MKRIGFIGLGNMGGPMSKNLIRAGHALAVYDMRSELTADQVAMGARAAASCRDAAEGADVVITMLPSSPNVEAAILGPNGVIEGVSEGAIVIDMSTIAPGMSKRVAAKLAERGVRMLDAPVTKGVTSAIDGTLSVLVGGDKAVLEECTDVLKAMASEIHHMGELGTGEVAKLAHNLMIGILTASVAEVLVLGVKAGVKAELLLEAIGSGPGNSGVLQKHYRDFALRGRFAGLFPVEYIMKDLALAQEEAKEQGVPLMFGGLAYQVYMAAKAAGYGKDYYPVVLKQLEELCGTKVRLEEA